MLYIEIEKYDKKIKVVRDTKLVKSQFSLLISPAHLHNVNKQKE